MLSINTNLSSFIAQNSLKSTSLKLDTAIERMTTGCKINHAKDNAANYSIATNMTTKIGAYQVAEDNALQGLEMMSTSLESLNQISDKLNRMRALAIQTQNGTYGTQSLNAISAEANALLDEITRINNSAEFNGIKLFSTGKMDVTNAGKELELNEQGFLQDVVKVDTIHMTKLSSVDPNATLAVGEYSISTVEELAQLATMANAGLLESGSTFTLANDIDIGAWCHANEANGGWVPISNFKGTFNGNGYSISNLISTKGGLFSSIKRNDDGNYSQVKNVKMSNVEINCPNSTYIGGIVGSAEASNIINCLVLGEIVGKNYTGGVVGYGFYGFTSYCYFSGSVQGNNRVGGITGWHNYSDSSSCMSEGIVKGYTEVGGIVGLGASNSAYCSANVQGTSSVGGISGSRATSKSYFSGTVQGETNIGGIVGETSQYAQGPQNCIMEGKVIGQTNVGILVGDLYSGKTVKDCYYYAKENSGIELAGTIDTGILTNNIDLAIPCDYTLQIASCGDSARSTLSYTTYIDFGELNNVLSSGIENAGTIEKIDNLVNVVSMKQTELGTGINRLESVLEEISTQYDNLVSSRSTLRDADMAEVSSDYIRQQILQQASATLMATANQSPAIALQLI